MASSRPPPELHNNPLQGHDTYEMVCALRAPLPAAAARGLWCLRSPTAFVSQVKVLNRGAFGVVVLAKDKPSGSLFALKFIERGPMASVPPRRRRHTHPAPPLLTSPSRCCCADDEQIRRARGE
jgi:hypothetical protein